MNDILKLSEDEKQIVFRNTALQMGVHEAIIEKDYWVCLVLDYLFNKSMYRNHLIFKGGTSLSKCFNLIRRFSEDIDIILDWRVLGYEKGEPWIERSKTKQDVFNKEAKERAEKFLANVFIEILRKDLEEIIGMPVKFEIDKTDPQTIAFHYPQLFKDDSILQVIRLEIGALAAWTPSVKRKITPYILELYPQASANPTTMIPTTSAIRTFWEKVTILHHEANRPEHLEMPLRYSRHYSDLACLANSEYKIVAFENIDLLRRVVEFKMKFYPRGWAKYEEAVPGTIKLLPNKSRWDSLKRDYIRMEEMLFGEIPSFESLMGSIKELEIEINDL